MLDRSEGRRQKRAWRAQVDLSAMQPACSSQRALLPAEVAQRGSEGKAADLARTAWQRAQLPAPSGTDPENCVAR